MCLLPCLRREEEREREVRNADIRQQERTDLQTNVLVSVTVLNKMRGTHNVDYVLFKRTT